MNRDDALTHYLTLVVRLCAAVAPVFVTAYALLLALVLHDYERATFWMAGAILAAMPTERAS